MAPDIVRLLRAMRAPEFEYRDPFAAASAQPSPRRTAWPGLLIVAVASLERGAGRTTLAANLATAVGRRGVRAAAIDLDPRDHARLHFRAATPSIRLPGSAVQWTERSVGYVPYGRDPVGVIETLAEGSGVVFLDTPAQPSPALEQALAEADEVLVVVRASPAAAETFRATEALLARWRRPAWRRTRARYVVNHFDARRKVDRDSLAALRAVAGTRLLAHAVQQDEAVRTALARGRCVQDEAPGSQVVADLQAIARDYGASDARTPKGPS